MECKISIIVPVYNSSPYLRSCIDSILKQSLSDWELLLVNDGSTDDSGEICDEYAGRYPAIRVIHKENAGVSAARNTGLAEATGEYIGFVDSDDTIRPEMYEEMYKVAILNHSEIVMCDAITVFPDGRTEPDTITQLPKSCALERKDWTPMLLKEMAGSACRCIYQRALVEKHQVSFPTSLKFSEDRIFNLYLMGYAAKLFYIKKGFYNRLVWEGSAVHRFHADYYEHIKKAGQATKRAIEAVWNVESKDYEKVYVEQLVGGAIGAINNYFYTTSQMSFRVRYRAIKRICFDDELQKVLRKSNRKDVRMTLLSHKFVFILCICAIVANKKNRR